MRTRVGMTAFVLVVLGGILFFATRTGTSDSLIDFLENTAPAPVTLTHTHQNGEHVFTGVRSVATPCDSVSAEAVVTNDGVVELRISETASEAICLLRSTSMTFSARVAAPEDAEILVLLNGVSADTVFE